MGRSSSDLRIKIQELQAQLAEAASRAEDAEETLRAIRAGEADALVISDRVYTLESADQAYRILVEQVQEGLATLQPDGMILYANQHLAKMLGLPLENLLGRMLADFVLPADADTFLHLLHRGTRGAGKAEASLVRKDGTLLPVLLSMSSMENHGLALVSLVATDLTEQKRQQEIVAAERLARSILEQASESILVCDNTGTVIRASEAACVLLGENPLYQPVDLVLPVEPVERQPEADGFSFSSVLRGETHKRLEVKLKPRKGSAALSPGEITLLLSASPIHSDGGAVLGFTVTFFDFSARKQAEQALQESEERYRELAERITDPLTVWDDQLRCTYRNKAAQNLILLPDEQVLGKRFEQVYPDLADSDLHRAYREALANRQPRQVETRWVRPADGQVFDLIHSIFPTREGIAAISHDLTGSKQGEKALLKALQAVSQSEQREKARASELATLMDAAPVMIWVSRDPECREMTGNRYGYEFLGMGQGANISKTALDAALRRQPYRTFKDGKEVPPDELPMQAAAQTGRSTDHYEFDLVFDNGTTRTVLGNVRPLWDEDGKPHGAMGVFMDITERKQVEEQLTYQAELLDRVHDAVIATDEQLRVTYWNPAAEAMFGWAAAEARGQEIFALLQTQGEVEPRAETVRRLLALEHDEGEVLYRQKPGTFISAHAKMVVFKGSRGEFRGLVSSIRDLSELRRAEESEREHSVQIELQRRLLEQREQERLQIARDLHDSPVQALIALTFNLRSLLSAARDPEMTEQLESVRGSLQEVIEELRSFASELRPPTLVKFGIGTAIESCLDGFHEKNPDISVRFENRLGVEQVPAESSLALYRILQESLVNVRKHALASRVGVSLRMRAGQAVLEIEDDGAGFEIPRDWLLLARKGHLGLVGMRERAQAAGGDLEIVSLPGKGTRLTARVSAAAGGPDPASSKG